MQAKDIDDRMFLTLVDDIAHDRKPGKYPGPHPYVPHWTFTWDLAMHLGLDDKLIRSKAAALIVRGLLDGCPCGCRGDFELTTKGTAYLATYSPGTPEKP